jgi:uncharacterized RDD family membrane protein YckC
MNIWFRQNSRGVLVALLLGLTLPLFAQPPAPKEAPTPTSPTPASPEATPAAPAATPETTPAPTPPAEAEEDRTKLRKIDGPPENGRVNREYRRRVRGGGEIPFGDHVVSKDSRVSELVSILGSNTIEGEVMSDAVSVGGSTTVGRDARVGGAAVAVLGRLTSKGTIKQDAVSVLGALDVDGPVGGDAVSVLGNMHLGPKAVIDGDVVVVGGALTKDPAAIINGNEVRVPVFPLLRDVEWLTTYLTRCVFYGRPLAFGHNLGWAWAIAFSFLAFYLLLGVLFPKGITRCAETLETRPGRSILASVLTVLLTPVAVVLLAITIVGALLVPFLGVGLLIAKLFGKAVMLAWIGRRFTKFFGDGPLAHPAFSVLIGGLIVLLLYTVPIVGFLSYKLLTWLGLGVAVYTVLLSMKRDRPPPAAAAAGAGLVPPAAPPSAPTYVAPVVPVAEPSPMASGVVAAPMTSAGFAGSAMTAPEVPKVPDVGPIPVPPTMDDPTTAGAPLPPVSNVVPPVPPVGSMAARPPVVPTSLAWPRAGFFLRLGALGLDGVLIGLIMAFVTGVLPRFLHFHNGPGGWLIALAVYGAIMWKLKGTTIGGIVCGLKVVRLDNREIDWATAVVRALSCFLSLAVAGLGFIWIAIDDERQSWHDKIAGTAVVVVPKGVSLI